MRSRLLTLAGSWNSTWCAGWRKRHGLDGDPIDSSGDESPRLPPDPRHFLHDALTKPERCAQCLSRDRRAGARGVKIMSTRLEVCSEECWAAWVDEPASSSKEPCPGK